jgi:peptide deformylase
MKREIVKYGAEVLRQVATPAEDNEESRQIIQDLKDTISTIPNGAGLAAPQIGESIRIFVTRDYDNDNRSNILTFINPEIITKSDLTAPCPDGCLSIPGASAVTRRHSFITVKYLDENFEPQEKEFQGFQSFVFQHENDHLDGILFIDKLSEEQQKTFKEFAERQANGERVIFANDRISEFNINMNIETNEQK